MKRVLLGATILGAIAALAGCPIYSGSGGSDYQVCDSTACYDCPDPSYTGACVPWSCYTSDDCPYGYECEGGRVAGQATLTCVAGPASQLDAGGCAGGCSSGYVCALSGGTPQCIPAGAVANDAGVFTADASSSYSDASPASGQDAAGDATPPSDAAPVGTDAAGDAAAGSPDGAAEAGLPLGGLCNADSQCASTGAKCVDGVCTSQAQLCSDGTQCVASNELCVDGLCLPPCSASVSCPAGYDCNFNLGVCSENRSVCASTAACTGGAVCVEGHCAAPCAAADAASGCSSGQVCVNGGCIPDQAAQATCATDGAPCTLPGGDGGGDGVCVHGACYAGCADGGACSGTDPVCKPVSGNGGTYDVCGTATDLGDQCDPAAGSYCAGGALCVDGYCR